MKLMAPSFNEAMISDRRTVANYMTEGSVVAIGAAITTSGSVATVAVVSTAPPKPIFMRIMMGGVVGTVLGALLAWVIIWYYRKEVLRG
jgi:hypothetical protein